MGLDLKQFRDYIVVPALDHIGLYSKAAERLVLATALAESNLKYVDQIERGGDRRPGPAVGLFQMEKETFEDIWKNYLDYRPDLAAKVRHLSLINYDAFLQMHGNALYAAAMCRVHYFRKKDPLPAADDLEGLGRYWKKHYNTNLGAGTVDGFLQKTYEVMAL